MAWVYILLSLKDRKRYIGSTIDLRKRLIKHNKGLVKSTRSRRPFSLIAYKKCETIKEAAYLEKKFKKSSDMIKRMIKNGDLITRGVV